ncbi:MAG: hypothetical protein WBY53_17730 [Acidobacteriaceae bacterium]
MRNTIALLAMLMASAAMAQQVRIASAGGQDASRPAQPVEINAPEPQQPEPETTARLDMGFARPGDVYAGGGELRRPVDQTAQGAIEPRDVKFIQPGRIAQPLDAHGKLVIGLEDIYSPLNYGGMIVAAGFEQVTNGAPNYGTDRGAFGERLGAAAIRDTSEGVLTDGVFASLLHEDPRYYVEGPQYSLVHRALYAITRPLITRTDSGQSTVNGALLLGYAASSVLNNAYYPSINRNVHDTVAEFGGSVGGAALGFAIGEFTSSLWHKVHLGRAHARS